MGATGIHLGSAHELPITSQGDLDAWERENRKKGIEYAVVLDKDGKPLTAFSGDEHSVGIRPEVLDWEGVTFTHNHPDKSFGGTFSTTDLNTFAKSKWAEMRADTGQGVTYIIKETPNSDKQKLLNYTRSQGKLLAKNFRNSYESALKKATTVYKDKNGNEYVKLKVLGKDGKIKTVKRPPMTPAQADKFARQYAVGLYDRTYEKNLKKFGFDYVVKKSKAGSNRPNQG